MNESCKPSEVIVQYNNETVTKGLSSATPVEEVYSVTADLEAGVCWEELDISVAYSNTEGQSEFSNVLRLEGPSTGEKLYILTSFQCSVSNGVCGVFFLLQIR